MISFPQLLEWVTRELVPAADPEYSAIAWNKLQYQGDITAYLHQPRHASPAPPSQAPGYAKPFGSNVRRKRGAEDLAWMTPRLEGSHCYSLSDKSSASRKSMTNNENHVTSAQNNLACTKLPRPCIVLPFLLPLHQINNKLGKQSEPRWPRPPNSLNRRGVQFAGAPNTSGRRARKRSPKVVLSAVPQSTTSGAVLRGYSHRGTCRTPAAHLTACYPSICMCHLPQRHRLSAPFPPRPRTQSAAPTK